MYTLVDEIAIAGITNAIIQNGFPGSSSHLLIGHRLNGFQISVGSVSGVFACGRQAGGLQVF